MNVPDYVFDENYKLMPLDELKAYVQKNNHLPGVVSADEVDKAGIINLSGLQMRLLEKVEELTLYTLQQEDVLAETKAKLEVKDAEMEVAQVEMKSVQVELKSKDAEMKVMRANMEVRQKAQDEKIAKLETILTNLALVSSTSDKEKVSMK